MPFETQARELALRSPGTLERAWRESPPARVEDLQGTLRARFVYLRGEKLLPIGARRVMRAVLFSRFFPLRSKLTRGREGINRFGVGEGQLGYMRYEVRRDIAWDDDKQVLALDYAVQENPRFLHPILDEICRLEPGFYLGRMGWRTRNQTLFGLYFTLERTLD